MPRRAVRHPAPAVVGATGRTARASCAASPPPLVPAQKAYVEGDNGPLALLVRCDPAKARLYIYPTEDSAAVDVAYVQRHGCRRRCRGTSTRCCGSGRPPGGHRKGRANWRGCWGKRNDAGPLGDRQPREHQSTRSGPAEGKF